MDCRTQCTFTKRIENAKCRVCQKMFNMKDSCCLDLCGEHSRCRGCRNGTRSEEFKEWRKTHVNNTKHLCN